jgi:hypothetical protein
MKSAVILVVRLYQRSFSRATAARCSLELHAPRYYIQAFLQHVITGYRTFKYPDHALLNCLSSRIRYVRRSCFALSIVAQVATVLTHLALWPCRLC